MKTSIKGLLILLVCMFASQALAQTVTIGQVSGLPGQTVTVPVTFTSDPTPGREVSTMALIMNYGGTYDSVSVPPTCGGDLSADQITCAAAPGVLQAILINDLGVTGPFASGIVANFDFAIPAAATPGTTDPIVFDLVNTLVGTAAPLNPPATLIPGSVYISEGPQPTWSSVPSSFDASPQFDFGVLNEDDAPPSMLPLTVTNAGEVDSLLNGGCYFGPPQNPVGAPVAVGTGFSVVGAAPQVVDAAVGLPTVIMIQFDPTLGVIGQNTGMVTCEHNGVGATNGTGGTLGDVGEPDPVSYNLTAQVMGYQNITNFQIGGLVPDPATVEGAGQLSATGGGSLNDVTFSSLTTDVCEITALGVVSFKIGGICTAAANQLGNDDYYDAPQVTLDITVNKLTQTITGFDTPTDGVVDGQGTLTAVSDATPTLDVTYVSTTPAVCTLTGSTVNYLTAGPCNLTADQAGDDRYEPATQVPLTITVAKADQTIENLAATPDPGMVGENSVLSASATSGLDVTFGASTTPTICSVTGSVVTYLAVGTCTIEADQPGDDNYNEATQVTIGVTVAPGDQEITNFFADPNGGGIDDTSTLFATPGDSTSPVLFSSGTPDICTVAGDVVTYIDTGTCTVLADQAADDNYNAAPQVALDITVGEATSIPTLSQWGLISMFLIMLGLGGMVIRRRDLLN